VIKQQLPSPAEWGLNAATTVLQVITEFINPPQPQATHWREDGDTDDELDFGIMRMPRNGVAFAFGSETNRIRVHKQWLLLDQRQCLVEQLPFTLVQPMLLNLPPAPDSAMLKTSPGSPLFQVAAHHVLPPRKVALNAVPTLKLAKVGPLTKGFVLDYSILSSQASLTLQGDTTYLLSGAVNVTSNLVVEGGAVVKVNTNVSASISAGNIICQTRPYGVAVFTAKDDDSVGDQISGSTHNPQGYYGGTVLNLLSAPAGQELSNLRFSYLSNAVAGSNLVLQDVQFVQCNTAIGAGSLNATLRNVLLYKVGVGIAASTPAGLDNPVMQNVTAHFCTNIMADTTGAINLTNCLFVVTTNWQCATTFTNASYFLSSDSGVFQTIAGGGHYLAGNTYRAEGSTNLPVSLLADLQLKTTQAPVLVSTDFPKSTNLAPQVARETGIPDIGYGYDPLDFVWSGRKLYGQNPLSGGNVPVMTLTNGVAIGMYGGTGLTMYTFSGNPILVSQGGPTNLNRLTQSAMVQEMPQTALTTLIGGNGTWTSIYLRFTDLPTLGGTVTYLKASDQGQAPVGAGPLNLRDCQLHGGQLEIALGGGSGTSSMTLGLTNNLFDRNSVTLWRGSPGSMGSFIPSAFVANLYNNLYHAGSLGIYFAISGSENMPPTGPYPPTWQIFDNLFENVNLTEQGYDGWTGSSWQYFVNNGYNGYNNSATLLVSSGGDKTNALADYQPGPLGSFYYPTTGTNLATLINAGNMTANLIGMYQYTTTTNQMKETNSTLDIGFHYVACDNNGNPLDSNTNGVPDYLEDVNGNGVVDSGENPWSLAILTQPVSQMVLPGTNVTFSVVAAGLMPIYYQWRFNGTNISGATSPTLTLFDVGTNKVGNYTVLVTNWNYALTSWVATLSFLPCTYTPSPGLIAWWRAEGDATDVYGSNNATLGGGATAGATGMVGQAFSFDGTNGYVDVPDSPALRPTNLTIEAWVLFNSSNSTHTTSVSNGTEYIVFRQNTNSTGIEGFDLAKKRFNGQDRFVFEVTSSGATNVLQLQSTNTVVTTGTWYHVAGVRGTNFLQLYVNGQLQGQTNISFPQVYSTNCELYFGSTGNGNQDGKLAGLLDEVALYNRALTSNEIAGIYSETNYGKCPVGLSATLITPVNGEPVLYSSNIVLTASAASIGGSVVKVDFYAGSNKLGKAVTPTNGIYTFIWTNAPLGPSALTAVSTDIHGTTASSAVANIYVDGAANFLLGVNLNGTNVVIESNSWSSYSAATNTGGGLSVSNAIAGTRTLTNLVPSADLNTSNMLQAFLQSYRMPPLSQQTNVNPVFYYYFNDSGVQSSSDPTDPYAYSYKLVTLTNSGLSGSILNSNVAYPGWGVDSSLQIIWGTLTPCTLLYTYGALDALCKPTNWNYVNYIINHRHHGTYKDINNAIWAFGLGTNGPYAGWPSTLAYTNIVNDALQNGANFVPTNGQIAMVIAEPTDSGKEPVGFEVTNFPVSFTMVQTNLTNGDYFLYLWLAENEADHIRSLSLNLQGATVASGLGSELQVGHWAKYGPYGATVTNGAMRMDIVSPTKGDPMLMGFALYQGVSNAAPTIQITSPISQTFLSPTNISITATAAAPATITLVQFFNGSNLVGFATNTSAGQYQASWGAILGGTNVFTAQVFDSRGSNAWSAPVTNIFRRPPTVVITNPVAGQYFPVPNTNILVQVSATPDIGATVTNVVLYLGTNAVLTNSSSSGAFTLTNVGSGTNAIRATAADSRGGIGASTIVDFVVAPTNQPPKVDAGPDLTIHSNEVAILNGKASDDGLPVGKSLTFLWSRTNGAGTISFDGGSLSTSTNLGTTAKFTALGTNYLQLVASDGQLSATSSVKVVVYQTNSPPKVYAGTNQTLILPALVNTNPFQTIQLVPITTNASTGAGFGVEYFIASNCVVVSVDAATNLELVSKSGQVTPFSSLTNLSDEVYLATARDTNAGFAVGEMFCGNGQAGEVMRIRPDGTTQGSQGALGNAWLVLPHGHVDEYLRGGLWVDRTGVWGGNLIVSTTYGNIWRIDSSGRTNLVAQLPFLFEHFYEGITTIPNDVQRYGPWAGKILVGGDYAPIFAIDTNGLVTTYDFGFGAEDIRVIPDNENLYAMLNLNSGGQALFGAAATEFEGMAGDVLLAHGDGRGAGGPDTDTIYRAHWNGTNFELFKIATPGLGGWEQMNFAPAGLLNLPVATNILLHGAVADDGQLYSSPSNSWVVVSGPGPVTFDDPRKTNALSYYSVPGDYVLQLQAYDGEFTSVTNVTNHVVRNQPPVVSAGTNQFITTNNTTLHGVVTDDGYPFGITNLLWSQVEGPAVATFGQATQAVTTVSLPQPGSYVFRLTADDGQATNAAEVTVYYSVPSLTLSPAQGLPVMTNTGVTLTATLLDGTGHAISNVNVQFSTNGVLSYPAPTTDVNGKAFLSYVKGNITEDVVSVTYTTNGYTVTNTALVEGAYQIGCGGQIAADNCPNFALEWPTNQTFFAGFYYFQGVSNQPVSLVATNNSAWIVRDPSNNICITQPGESLTFTPATSGQYLVEEVQMEPNVPGGHGLWLTCQGQQYPPDLPVGLGVLCNGTNVPAFGTVPFTTTGVGASNMVHLVITNTGGSDSVLSAISIQKPDNDETEFWITNDVSSYHTLPSGGTFTLGVSFAPKSSGAHFAAITIEENSESPPQGYVLYTYGVGSNASISLPQITLSSPQQDMVFSGPADVPLTLTINSNGYTGDIAGTNYFQQGAYSIDPIANPFHVYGSSSDYTVTASITNSSGVLLASAPPVTFHVRAVPTEMAVMYSGTNVPSGSAIILPPITPGASTNISLVISNAGTVGLVVSNIVTVGAFTNGTFVATTPLPLWLPQGAATNFTILFTNAPVGVTAGALALQKADGGDDYTLYLGASAFPTGTPPSITLVSPLPGVPLAAPANIPLVASVTPGSTNVSYVDFVWLQTNGPAVDLGAVFSSPYALTLPNIEAGTFTFSATAVDALGRSSNSPPLTVTILPPNGNNPPIASNDVFHVLANSANNLLQPLLNDFKPSATNNYRLAGISSTPGGPYVSSLTIADGGGVAFINPDLATVTYTPPYGFYSQDGEPADGFYYEISDGNGGTAYAAVSIVIDAENIPVPTLSSSTTSTSAGSPVTLTATLTAWQYVTNVEFFLGKTSIGSVTNGPSGIYQLNWTALYDGCGCDITAQARDSFGQIGTSQPIHVTVTNSPTAGLPFASIDSLQGTNETFGAAQLTTLATLRDGKYNLNGTIYHTSGSNTTWKLGVYNLDGSLIRDLTPPGASVPANNHYTNAQLATLDFTTLLNGIYDLRLIVSGGYAETNTSVRFRLESNLKLGQFSFSQQDLVIPVKGVPLTVVRTYNSLNPIRGDFGYGWTWALNDMQVELDEERTDVPADLDTSEGEGESMSAYLSSLGDDTTPPQTPGTFSLRTGGGRDITLTLPNGQRTTFLFNFSQGANGTYYAQWIPAPGVTATFGLQPGMRNGLETIIGGIVNNPDLYYWDSTGVGVPMDSYDFRGFVLTNQDGTQYYLDRQDLGEHTAQSDTVSPYFIQTYGKPFLSKIVQRSGDTIQISGDAIQHKDTNGVIQQVLFHRNERGLIDAIYDPISQAGGSSQASAIYHYDARDNLMSVEILKDRASGIYTTNSFSYTNVNFPHYVTGIVNADGTQVAKNFYDDSGKLTAVQDADGNLTKFIHSTNANLEVVIDRRGFTNSYAYDLHGNVIATTNAVGGITMSAYDDVKNKLGETNYLNGNPYATNSYVYDTSGDPTRLNLLLYSIDPLGHSNVFTYDGYAHVVTTKDARGNISTNYYDSNTGNMTGTSDALGDLTTNYYDGNGLLLGSVDAIGTATTNVYVSENLVGTATKDRSGVILSTNTFAYDSNNNRTNSAVWRSLNGSAWTSAVTTYIYDAQNRVFQTIDPDGGTNTVVYDVNGRQQATVDKLGRTTSFVYDDQGRLTKTTYPDQTTETSGYDSNGNRTNSVDKFGRVTSYFYDALNRLTNTLYADNASSSTVYDDLGRVKWGIDARGVISASGYDAAGRRTSVTNALGVSGVQAVMQYTFDENGNQLTFTDPNGHTTTNVFDALNRQFQVRYADGTKTGTAYDPAGRRTAETNQDSVVTAFAYDGAGRLAAVTNALTNATLYAYDEAGNQTNQVDALGHKTFFEFDSMGRRTKRTLPGGQFETMGYDLAGNLIFATNFNGVVMTNAYDVMNRLTNKSSVGGYRVGFTYTLTGQRQTMVDSSGTTSYSYDNRDRLQTKTTGWNAGPTIELNYTYDLNGNVSNLWSSTSGGVNLVYNYDALNRLTNVLANGNQSAKYGFDPNGNLQTSQFGNGVVTNVYQYDLLNRLTNSTWRSHGTNVASFFYKLGATGNRTNLIETVANLAATTYQWQYDPLYRLTNENISALGTLGYKLDGVGNRTNRFGSGSLATALPPVTNSFGLNDWLSTNAYDLNGNTTYATNSGIATGPYRYDAENRLTNFNATNFTYNGDEIRITKSTNGVTVLYLVDDRNPSAYAQVLEEYVGSSGSYTLSKVYSCGLSLVSQTEKPSGAVHYYGTDGHGSTRFLTDSSGSVSDTYTYDAYGTLISSNGSTANNFLYCCEQFDPETGMYYLRARYYQPATGRFWTMDSYQGDKQDPPSLHKYLYCQADPVDNSDPSGRDIGEMLAVLDISFTLATFKSGPTSLKPLDPGRPLTEGEVSLSTSIFGTTINYPQVTIRRRGYFLGFQFRGYLVTPNGHIYAPVNGGAYSPDYSKEAVAFRAVFLHEMTHVWQHQVGMHVGMRRLFGEGNYDYNKNNFGSRNFTSYSIEQQAHIVEDFYLLLFGQPIYDYDNGWFRVYDPPPIDMYRKVLGVEFPNVQ
jgi:RHS repeat-associated protein